MTDSDFIAKAQALGAEHGTLAGKGRFDGNTDIDTYRSCVQLHAVDDPEWWDTYGVAGDVLSGEYADDMTPARLYAMVGHTDDASLDANELCADICDAYEQAFTDAYTAAVLGIARGQVWSYALNELGALTPYRLAQSDFADCGSPEALDSHGAEFLTTTRDAFVEHVRYVVDDDEDSEHDSITSVLDGMVNDGTAADLADSAPSVYTYPMWQQFADLAAFEEDLSDYVVDSETGINISRLAAAALYAIAERLISALGRELARLCDEEWSG